MPFDGHDIPDRPEPEPVPVLLTLTVLMALGLVVWLGIAWATGMIGVLR